MEYDGDVSIQGNSGILDANKDSYRMLRMLFVDLCNWYDDICIGFYSRGLFLTRGCMNKKQK